MTEPGLIANNVWKSERDSVSWSVILVLSHSQVAKIVPKNIMINMPTLNPK